MRLVGEMFIFGGRGWLHVHAADGRWISNTDRLVRRCRT